MDYFRGSFLTKKNAIRILERLEIRNNWELFDPISAKTIEIYKDELEAKKISAKIWPIIYFNNYKGIITVFEVIKILIF